MGVSHFHYNKDYNRYVMRKFVKYGVSHFHYNKDYNMHQIHFATLQVYLISIITRITTSLTQENRVDENYDINNKLKVKI